MVKNKDNLLLAFVIYWVLFIAILLCEPFYNSILLSDFFASLNLDYNGSKDLLRGEYRLVEQLSKLYLFLSILISVVVYRRLDERVRIIQSIFLAIFSLIVFICESNMIVEKYQPAYGVVIGLITFYFLLVNKNFAPLITLSFVFVCFLSGDIIDYVRDSGINVSWLTSDPDAAAMIEERFDVLGAALICWTSVLAFSDRLFKFFRMVPNIAIVLLVIASGIISFSDGFLHAQFNPNWKLVFLAMTTSIFGFLLILIINEKLIPKDQKLILIGDLDFYALIFIFFVFLPAIFAYEHDSTTFILWPTTIVLMIFYLWPRRILEK